MRRLCFAALILALSLLISTRGVAQRLPQQPPSCPDCEPRPKHFWRASGELFVVWWIPWAVNYYIRDAEFAKVTPKSWWDNITGDWVWDDNNFQTNQFAHPMHGNYYFNAFRSNGYNFWESSIAAIVGSYGWECCGETHPPAPNDMINTSLGGITLGEMFWRLSNLTLDNRATGSERTWREIGAFALSPWNVFNRVVDGRVNDVNQNPPDWRPQWVQGSLDVGPRFIGSRGNSFDVLNDPLRDLALTFRLIYGRPVLDLVGKPFSTFTVVGELGLGQDRQKLQVLTAHGNIGGKVLSSSESATHILAARMDYDYYFFPNADTAFNAVVYEYGGQSFTGGINSTFRLGKSWRLISDVHLRGVAIGAVRSDYYEISGEGRNYDFGPGLGAGLQATVGMPGKVLFTGAYDGTWIHTLNGTDYDHYLAQGTLDARWYVSSRFGIGARYDYAFRQSTPTDPAVGPVTNITVPQARFFISTAIPRWSDISY
ncbi:MAG TPA: DUF3943 domain-containing protein [Gemmatimonadales bacterium]